MALSAIHLDSSTPGFDDPVTGRESQTRPYADVFSREKRLEQILEILVRNPAPGVLNVKAPLIL